MGNQIWDAYMYFLNNANIGCVQGKIKYSITMFKCVKMLAMTKYISLPYNA